MRWDVAGLCDAGFWCVLVVVSTATFLGCSATEGLFSSTPLGDSGDDLCALSMSGARPPVTCPRCRRRFERRELAAWLFLTVAVAASLGFLVGGLAVALRAEAVCAMSDCASYAVEVVPR